MSRGLLPDAPVKQNWGVLKPNAVSITDTSEKPGKERYSRVTVPAYGLVSVLVELPR